MVYSYIIRTTVMYLNIFVLALINLKRRSTKNPICKNTLGLNVEYILKIYYIHFEPVFDLAKKVEVL